MIQTDDLIPEPITEEKSGLHEEHVDIEMTNIYQNSEKYCGSPCRNTSVAIENGENRNGISTVASNNQVNSEEITVNYAVI